MVERLAPRGSAPGAHGFSGVIISRAVAHRLGDPDSDAPLLFIGDRPSRFVVDGTSLRRPLPEIAGMVATDRYEAWAWRKLATFSAGHAAAAYLAHLKGYRYIHAAVRDPEIRSVVLGAMREGQRALAARFGPEFAGDERDLADILARFENARLADSVARVGREPGRKLRPDERLVGAARLARSAGLGTRHLGLAIAAAMFFDDPRDPSAIELKRQVALEGLGPALRRITGLDSGRGLGRTVARTWRRLSGGRRQGRLLLNLDRLQWA